MYGKVQAMYPFMTEWHQRRSIVSMLGTQSLDYSKS